jgi:hypothetical protein
VPRLAKAFLLVLVAACTDTIAAAPGVREDVGSLGRIVLPPGTRAGESEGTVVISGPRDAQTPPPTIVLEPSPADRSRFPAAARLANGQLRYRSAVEASATDVVVRLDGELALAGRTWQVRCMRGGPAGALEPTWCLPYLASFEPR